MKFTVHVPVLNGDDFVLALLDRLVDRLAAGVHWIDVPDADQLQGSDWYQQARPTRRKVLTSALARPPRSGPRHEGPHAKSMHLLDAESAVVADKLAHAPLLILVEDREADGVLLDIIVEKLGWPELLRLWRVGRKLTPRAVEIDTAGGKDAMPERIRRTVSDAKEAERPHRLFVVCDCDKRWPDDHAEERLKPLNAIKATCSKHTVPLHIWTKRAAENYIPDEIFEAVRDDPRNTSKRDVFNAFLNRSRTQRDYFPVKDGLQQPERQAAIQAGLYNQTDERDLAVLEERLFAKRPRPLLLLGRERRSEFTAEGLQARDGDGELDRLLRAIAQEL